MATEGGDETVQLVTWGIAALGIGANLWWNWRNRKHINATAAKIRSEQHQLDRWSRLRGRIETNLGVLCSALRNAPVFYGKLDPNQAVTAPPMDILGLEIFLAHDDLARALEEADRADFCESCEWAPLANGRYYGSETSWDVISTIVYNATKLAMDRVAYLRQLKRYADDIEVGVREAIDRQDADLDPEKIL